MCSVNGALWTQVSINTSFGINDICWTGTQFVGVGSSKVMVTSPDGVNWTGRPVNIPDNIHLMGVASSGSNIVAVGRNLTNSRTAILNSVDGINWAMNEFVLNPGDLFEIIWSGSLYVAVGMISASPAIISSPDGITWTKSSNNTVEGKLIDIVYSGSRYVAVGYYNKATSTDGVNWNIYSNAAFSAPGITWSGSKFVAASLNYGIYSSVDGLNWTKTCDAPALLNGITWSGVQYVAVGSISPIIMVSPN
jgi:hypothetical protein